MQIRTKIAIQFSIIVATILAIFSLSIYYLSENYRRQEFYNSLKDRALTTAQLLIKEKEIDKKLLKVIDRNTLTTLYAVKVLVFNEEDKLLYSNIDAETIYYSPELLKQIRREKFLETNDWDNQVVGMIYKDEKNNDLVVLASASDTYGFDKLRNIKATLITGFLFGIFLTIVFGFIFASQSLRPISEMNREISKISAYNLQQKLSTGNNKDEIAQLAINFNAMLERLEKSFELQRSFVSNASHELRTPLAALKSEIQIALEKERTSDEYQQILSTLLVDNQRLIQLTNGLLQLAKSENQDSKIQMGLVRVDELLFMVQEEISYQHPNYQVFIDFEEIPEDDKMVSIKGNESLLKTLFTNLFDNACKYSDTHKTKVKITFDAKNCIVSVKDEGIGIPKVELDRIFEPFYRTQNATSFAGHGIGLSICRRIVEMHKGKIKVESQVGVGSTFIVQLPHK